MNTRKVLLLLAVLLAVAHCLWFSGFLVDDAAISFSYARSIAHGAGAVITPGGERVEGYTNFLWVALLAGGIRLGADPFLLAHLLGALLCVLVVLGTARLCHAVRGAPDVLDGAAACLVALIPPVAYWSMSGLEGGLYTALVVGCLARLVFERDDATAFPWSAIFAAGCALTRPDGASILVLGLVYTLACGQRRKLWLFLALVPVLAHEAWRYVYYAWPVPNTFYAKVSSAFRFRELVDYRSQGWSYVLGFVMRYWLFALVVPALLALVPGRRWTYRIIVVLALGAIVFFPIYARGDWMSEGRFLVAGVPLLCALAINGVDRLGSRWWVRAIPIVACAALVLPISLKHSWERHGNYPVPAAFVAKRGLHYKEVAARYHVAHPSALDGDLGGTSYYSGMPIVDLGMLADVTLARSRKDPSIEREYVLGERRPTLMRLAGFWLDDGLQLYPEFIDRYVPSGMADITVDRSVFLAEDVDPRKPLMTGDADGIDVLGVHVGPELEAWLLPRRVGGVVPEVRGSVTTRLEDKLYTVQRWRAGEIVHVRMPRPMGDLQLCIAARCTPLKDGYNGVKPMVKPRPGVPEVLTALERLDVPTAQRLELDTADVGAKLEARADHERTTGDTAAAFADYLLALRANPSLSFARKHLEGLRLSPRAQYRDRDAARLHEALRDFRLAPDADKLGTIALLAHAANLPSEATWAAVTTGLVPTDEGKAALAWCYAADGLPEQARALGDTKVKDAQRWVFDGNDTMGWTAAGAPVAVRQIAVGSTVRGVEGHGYLASTGAGTLTSPALREGVDEVCFVMAGSRAGAGVRIDDGAPVLGRNDEFLRDVCLPATAGAHVVVFAEQGHSVLADDFGCYTHGRPVDCGGT
ncbi:MAG: hypothetical protein ABI321_11130 [Polyangia bacterium]